MTLSLQSCDYPSHLLGLQVDILCLPIFGEFECVTNSIVSMFWCLQQNLIYMLTLTSPDMPCKSSPLLNYLHKMAGCDIDRAALSLGHISGLI